MVQEAGAVPVPLTPPPQLEVMVREVLVLEALEVLVELGLLVEMCVSGRYTTRRQGVSSRRRQQ
jgi:hypothetical protein